MLRSDLETAREEWLEQAERQPDEHARQEEVPFLRQDTDEGTIDFHALRHTFISNLAESGVHPKVAQKLARRSTITLTLDRCSHVELVDLSAALQAMPALPTVQTATPAASGTDSNAPRASLGFALPAVESCSLVRTGEDAESVSGATGQSQAKPRNRGRTAVS